MTSRLANISFDCAKASVVAQFWSAVIGRPGDSEPKPGEHFASIGLDERDQGSWLFAKVPEPKTAKNSCQVDLATDDSEAEIARLVSFGATHVADKTEWGFSWTVMTDPEGNAFCVARVTSRHDAAQPR